MYFSGNDQGIVSTFCGPQEAEHVIINISFHVGSPEIVEVTDIDLFAVDNPGQLRDYPLHVLPGGEAVPGTPEERNRNLDLTKLVGGRLLTAVSPDVLRTVVPVVGMEGFVSYILTVVKDRVERGLGGLGMVTNSVEHFSIFGVGRGSS